MKGRSVPLFPLILVFVLAMTSFWLKRVVELPDVSARPKKHEADFSVDNFVLTQINKDGQANSTLAAKRMAHFADDESTELTLPRLDQRKPGEPPFQITSRRGTVDRDGNIVKLYDDVVGIRAAANGHPPMRLDTSFMEVDVPNEVGTSPEKVLVTRSQSTLEGVGMVFRNKTRELELHAQVHGTYVKEKP